MHAKDLVCLRIMVVGKELRIRPLGIPVEHGTLLWIPGPRALNHRNRIVMVRLNEHDVSSLSGQRHPVLRPRLQGQDVPATGIPRNGLQMADVAKKVMQRSMGDLPHRVGKFSGGGEMRHACPHD